MCSPFHLMWMLFFPEEKEHIICKTIYLAPSHPIYHSRECRDKSLSPTHVHIHTHKHTHTHTHKTFPIRKEKKRKHAPATGSEQLSKHNSWGLTHTSYPGSKTRPSLSGSPLCMCLFIIHVFLHYLCDSFWDGHWGKRGLREHFTD